MFSGKSTTAKGEQAHANAAPGAEMQQSSVQQQLPIGAVNDPMELEADLMADSIMRMPESPVIQRRCAYCEEDRHVQKKSLSPGITPFIQARANEGGATASDAVTTQINNTRGGGDSLPGPTKTFMESRFGSDFSGVRIHNDGQAAALSGALNAQAFTVGKDIYFNSGKYAPDSPGGKHLLAHELTHTIQQGGGDAVNRKPIIQKADGDKAKTAFGEFEAVKYHSLKQKASGKEVGVEMFLKFNPGANVDAKQIALTQSVTGQRAGTNLTALDPNYGRRSATSGAGKANFIDVLTGFPSPLYATKDQPTAGADASKLTSYPVAPSSALTPAEVTARETATGVTGETRKGFGKHGFRFTEAGQLKGPESAELYDSPNQGPGNNTEITFESTALAIEGTQQGTYYGSVQWGWKIDGTGAFSMVNFKAVSQAVPSVNFLTAASIFNGATEEFNWGVNAATAKIFDAHGTVLATLTKGTALMWGGAQVNLGPKTVNIIKVKDGPSAGTVGIIDSAEMGMMDVGRTTVDLPVTEVFTTTGAATSMVKDPAKAGATAIKDLPKDTRVSVTDNKTNKDWSKIKIVDGPDTNKEGWVKKTSLARETPGTR